MRATSHHRRQHGRGFERGTGGVEVLALGVLVLVLGTLLVANMWAVVDAKHAAISAAREAARVAVESSDGPTARARAVEAGRRTLTALGRTAERSQVELEGNFGRCQRVVATVRVDVAAIALPGVSTRAYFHVRAEHSEVVDPYRSGLAGVARCE